jgi:DNA primase
MEAEDIKKIDLVEFLSKHYGMTFSRQGDSYASLSSLSAEKTPSFFVRQVGDKWLFKDFSSGQGGSLLDFVLLKEGYSEVSEAFRHIAKLQSSQEINPKEPIRDQGKKKDDLKIDIKELYQQIKKNDPGHCIDYLHKRGISTEVIEKLRENDLVLHNRYQGRSWCCFAVFSPKGELCCLDNHELEGKGKFALGKKEAFSLDWDILPEAKKVYISEGIIDYLSLKTLYGETITGLALLGNKVAFDAELLGNTQEIVCALDSDEGGLRGLLDLQERFPDKEINVFPLGDCKDPNEYLLSIKRTTNLTPEDKLAIYKEYMVAENKSEIAQKWKINRSYMYQIVKECEEIIIQSLQDRPLGRRRENVPTNLKEAVEKIATLEKEKEQVEIEKETYYAKNAFLQVRLKWSEIEAAELRKKSSQEQQVKKKKNRRP